MNRSLSKDGRQLKVVKFAFLLLLFSIFSDEFCFVMISALSHLGSDLPYLPSARLHDRVLYLSFVRYNRLPSRIQMAMWLLNMSNGYHLTSEWFEVSSEV